MYGDYRAIRRNYLPQDFCNDIGVLPVIKSVHVQAEIDVRDRVRETRWLQALADTPGGSGFPHAIIAYADLSAPAAEVEATLVAHAAFANLRGIRQMAHQALIPGMGRPANHLADERWCANLGLLVDHGLSFDLQILPAQAIAAAQLVARYPRLQFVLVHAGQPRNQSPAGLSDWRKGLRRLAEFPNVAIKLSGFGMFDAHWTIDSLRPLVLHAIDCFGPQRTMFGSNFPVDGMMRSYAEIWDAYSRLSSAFDDTAREELFCGTAQRVYRI